MLSAVIISRNEVDRIEAAIRSVAFADEVLVVDAGSTDGTVERAAALGARVVSADWPGHVAQKNRAWALAAGDWILSLDADEVVGPELAVAVRAAVGTGRAVGFRVRRLNHWLGHPLRHGLWYPDRRVRLARKDRARWAGEDPHDHLEVDGPVADLDGELLHHPYRSLADHFTTIDTYTRTAASGLAARGQRARTVDIYLRPPWHFVRAFLIRGGFRDGLPGLCVATLGAVYCLLKWGRLRGLGAGDR